MLSECVVEIGKIAETYRVGDIDDAPRDRAAILQHGARPLETLTAYELRKANSRFGQQMLHVAFRHVELRTQPFGAQAGIGKVLIDPGDNGLETGRGAQDAWSVSAAGLAWRQTQ